MLSTTKTIRWEGQKYFGGEEIGFTNDGTFVMALYTTEPAEQRGTYFTALPISPTSYREKHPTKAAIRDNGNSVSIYCDWGREHLLVAPRSIIKALLEEAAEHQIPGAAIARALPQGAPNAN